MSDVIYVIVRETGEYEMRTQTPVRFVYTEDAAKEACARAEEEGRTLKPPPYPDLPRTHGWQMPDGSWLSKGWPGFNTSDAKWTAYPDADARDAESERLRAEYKAACLAMGCVDPEGPDAHASYDYEMVRMLPSPLPPASDSVDS